MSEIQNQLLQQAETAELQSRGGNMPAVQPEQFQGIVALGYAASSNAAAQALAADGPKMAVQQPCTAQGLALMDAPGQQHLKDGQQQHSPAEIRQLPAGEPAASKPLDPAAAAAADPSTQWLNSVQYGKGARVLAAGSCMDAGRHQQLQDQQETAAQHDMHCTAAVEPTDPEALAADSITTGGRNLAAEPWDGHQPGSSTGGRPGLGHTALTDSDSQGPQQQELQQELHRQLLDSQSPPTDEQLPRPKLTAGTASLLAALLRNQQALAALKHQYRKTHRSQVPQQQQQQQEELPGGSSPQQQQQQERVPGSSSLQQEDLLQQQQQGSLAGTKRHRSSCGSSGGASPADQGSLQRSPEAAAAAACAAQPTCSQLQQQVVPLEQQQQQQPQAPPSTAAGMAAHPATEDPMQTTAGIAAAAAAVEAPVNAAVGTSAAAETTGRTMAGSASEPPAPPSAAATAAAINTLLPAAAAGADTTAAVSAAAAAAAAIAAGTVAGASPIQAGDLQQLKASLEALLGAQLQHHTAHMLTEPQTTASNQQQQQRLCQSPAQGAGSSPSYSPQQVPQEVSRQQQQQQLLAEADATAYAVALGPSRPSKGQAMHQQQGKLAAAPGTADGSSRGTQHPQEANEARVTAGRASRSPVSAVCSSGLQSRPHPSSSSSRQAAAGAAEATEAPNTAAAAAARSPGSGPSSGRVPPVNVKQLSAQHKRQLLLRMQAQMQNLGVKITGHPLLSQLQESAAGQTASGSTAAGVEGAAGHSSGQGTAAVAAAAASSGPCRHGPASAALQQARQRSRSPAACGPSGTLTQGGTAGAAARSRSCTPTAPLGRPAAQAAAGAGIAETPSPAAAAAAAADPSTAGQSAVTPDHATPMQTDSAAAAVDASMDSSHMEFARQLQQLIQRDPRRRAVAALFQEATGKEARAAGATGARYSSKSPEPQTASASAGLQAVNAQQPSLPHAAIKPEQQQSELGQDRPAKRQRSSTPAAASGSQSPGPSGASPATSGKILSASRLADAAAHFKWVSQVKHPRWHKAESQVDLSFPDGGAAQGSSSGFTAAHRQPSAQPIHQQHPAPAAAADGATGNGHPTAATATAAAAAAAAVIKGLTAAAQAGYTAGQQGPMDALCAAISELQQGGPVTSRRGSLPADAAATNCSSSSGLTGLASLRSVAAQGQSVPYSAADTTEPYSVPQWQPQAAASVGYVGLGPAAAAAGWDQPNVQDMQWQQWEGAGSVSTQQQAGGPCALTGVPWEWRAQHSGTAGMQAMQQQMSSSRAPQPQWQQQQQQQQHSDALSLLAAAAAMPQLAGCTQQQQGPAVADAAAAAAVGWQTAEQLWANPAGMAPPSSSYQQPASYAAAAALAGRLVASSEPVTFSTAQEAQQTAGNTGAHGWQATQEPPSASAAMPTGASGPPSSLHSDLLDMVRNLVKCKAGKQAARASAAASGFQEGSGFQQGPVSTGQQYTMTAWPAEHAAGMFVGAPALLGLPAGVHAMGSGGQLYGQGVQAPHLYAGADGGSGEAGTNPDMDYAAALAAAAAAAFSSAPST